MTWVEHLIRKDSFIDHLNHISTFLSINVTLLIPVIMNQPNYDSDFCGTSTIGVFSVTSQGQFQMLLVKAQPTLPTSVYRKPLTNPPCLHRYIVNIQQIHLAYIGLSSTSNKPTVPTSVYNKHLIISVHSFCCIVRWMLIIIQQAPHSYCSIHTPNISLHNNYIFHSFSRIPYSSS